MLNIPYNCDTNVKLHTHGTLEISVHLTIPIGHHRKTFLITVVISIYSITLLYFCAINCVIYCALSLLHIEYRSSQRTPRFRKFKESRSIYWLFDFSNVLFFLVAYICILYYFVSDRGQIMHSILELFLVVLASPA